MEPAQSLQTELALWAGSDEARTAVADTVLAMAKAGIVISDTIGLGALAGRFGESVGTNADHDRQTKLDVQAHDHVIAALKQAAPVAFVGSEESHEAIRLAAGAPLAVVVDPLDGSSNIETNVSVGTIFSVYPAGRTLLSLLQPGIHQLAAGFIIYGPATALVLALGDGVRIFTLDRRCSTFLLTSDRVRIPPGRREYAINASNARFWDEPVRAFIEDCVGGAEGPSAADWNTRWIASLVAEAYRILTRGGVFLYPRDRRRGYRNGRLRLVYEANPIAFIMEQAGGAATTGEARILDLHPTLLHERVPLAFGARDIVERLGRYHAGSPGESLRSPLFGRRGLLRV